MLEDIETTQTMENNLKRLVKNQNYFSCFFQNREPSNPFQKRLFQKKMRRSTVSCSDNYHQPTQIHQLNNQINQVNNYLQKQQYSRQFEERIQRTTSIVKNQIQLLKEKLLKKQQLIMKDHRISQSKKRMLLRQLAENVQKTTSFIIQNCLHIQESIICPSYEQVQRQSENNKQNLQMNYYKHQMKQQKQIKNLEESDVQLKKTKRNEEKMKQKISCKQRTGAEHQNSNNSSYFSNPISSNSNHHHSCQNKYHLKQMEQKEHKSIYQAVLDERERRLKNIKKKIV